jgi:hypothetical protein
MGVNVEHELKARLECLKPAASTPAPRSLTAKQKAFVNEHPVDLNGTQATIRARFSISRMKSFDQWASTCTPSQWQMAGRLAGSPRACYDRIRKELLEMDES